MQRCGCNQSGHLSPWAATTFFSCKRRANPLSALAMRARTSAMSVSDAAGGFILAWKPQKKKRGINNQRLISGAETQEGIRFTAIRFNLDLTCLLLTSWDCTRCEQWLNRTDLWSAELSCHRGQQRLYHRGLVETLCSALVPLTHHPQHLHHQTAWREGVLMHKSDIKIYKGNYCQNHFLMAKKLKNAFEHYSIM